MSYEAIITAQDLELRHNEQVLFDHASLAVGEHDRIGLVGRNGAGKSTLLRILAGELTPDSGNVTRRRGLVVGYLPQDFTLDAALTVEQNVRSGAAHILELIHQFETMPGDSPRHGEVEERIQHFDGWNLDSRIKQALSELGCPPGDNAIAALSGGEKRRVALARAIVAQPDLLILDEPTNHLDTESVEWIVEFLADYPGALLVVTHDRHFLDRVATDIVELRNGSFDRYSGNYSDYILERSERLATEELQEHKRQMFLRREIDWVRRQPKARTTKSQSRLDRYDDALNDAPPASESDMELCIPPAPPLGNRVADLEKIGFRIPTPEGRWLFRGLDLAFAAGQRIGITGRNGLGKTSLLRILIEQSPPTEGVVRIGQLTKFNYVDQGRLQLREDRTVLEEVSDGTEFVIWGDTKLSLRAYLKRFLFTDDRITKQVKWLSGGERSRLLLARILKQGGNFLILDEPTNDLDLQTLRVLEEALLAFQGCVLVVSHDRYFLNRVCTGILAFEGDGRVAYSVGSYDYYLEKRRREAIAAAEPKTAPAAAKQSNSNAPQPAKKKKLSFKEQKEIEGMETAIHDAEAAVAKLEAALADPAFFKTQGSKANAVIAELDAAKKTTAKLYARWSDLEALNAGS